MRVPFFLGHPVELLYIILPLLRWETVTLHLIKNTTGRLAEIECAF